MKKLICALLAVFILFSFTGCGTRSYEDTNGLVLVINDEIVHDFGLKGMNQNFTLENVTGAVSLRIAGESTGYSIKYELK